MSKELRLPKLEMKLREIRRFDSSTELFDYVQSYNLNDCEFAIGWIGGCMKNKCWIKRTK